MKHGIEQKKTQTPYTSKHLTREGMTGTPQKITSFNPKNLSRYGWMSQGLLTHTKWAQKPGSFHGVS